MLHFRQSKLSEQLLKPFCFNISITVLFLLQLYKSTFCLATCRKLHLKLCRKFALNLEDVYSDIQLEIQTLLNLRKFLYSQQLKPLNCLLQPLEQQKNRDKKSHGKKQGECTVFVTEETQWQSCLFLQNRIRGHQNSLD